MSETHAQQQAVFDRKLREDQAIAKACQHTRKEGLVGKMDQAVFMEAVRQEGPEVLSPAAQGYWDDMTRLYPHLSLNGRVPDGRSLNGRYGRQGKVSKRWVRGVWYIWDNGGWVPEKKEQEHVELD